MKANRPPNRPTSWLFFDDDNVYVAARCWDCAPGAQVANEMRRDSTNSRQNENFARARSIPSTIAATAFSSTTNPLGGVRRPGHRRRRRRTPTGTRSGTCESARFEDGWTVEMAIPFKSLRYQPGRDQMWGVNVRRVVRWKNEMVVPDAGAARARDVRGSCRSRSAATLVGIEAPPARKNLEIKPYAISARRDRSDGVAALRTSSSATSASTRNTA